MHGQIQTISADGFVFDMYEVHKRCDNLLTYIHTYTLPVVLLYTGSLLCSFNMSIKGLVRYPNYIYNIEQFENAACRFPVESVSWYCKRQ